MAADGAALPFADRSFDRIHHAAADYTVLLSATGWDVYDRIDVTVEFARCMDVLLEESHARRDALLELLGEQDYTERLDRRQCTRVAVPGGCSSARSFATATTREG